VTLKRSQNVKYRSYAFTAYGALMTANILSSSQAVQISIFVVRDSAKMREALPRTLSILLISFLPSRDFLEK